MPKVLTESDRRRRHEFGSALLAIIKTCEIRHGELAAWARSAKVPVLRNEGSLSAVLRYNRGMSRRSYDLPSEHDLSLLATWFIERNCTRLTRAMIERLFDACGYAPPTEVGSSTMGLPFALSIMNRAGLSLAYTAVGTGQNLVWLTEPPGSHVGYEWRQPAFRPI
jgi:hypothetical protein